MNLKPSPTRVLVKANKRASDIEMPQGVKAPLTTHRVLAVGNEVTAYKIDDDVLLLPNCHGLEVDPGVGLVDQTAIIAVVLPDTTPFKN